MRPEADGIVLTTQDEFVVIGQANSGTEKERLEDTMAISRSLNYLQRRQSGNEKPEWMIPVDSFMESQMVLHGVIAAYSALKHHQDAGSYCESASPEYNRLSQLQQVSRTLLKGVFEQLGVPSK